MAASLIPSRRRIYASRFVAALFLATVIIGSNHWKKTLPCIVPVFHLVGWFLVSLGVLGRVWSSSYISGHKTVSLQQEGPYSICRNPLYFFSFMAGLGITLLTGMLSMSLTFAVAFLTYYRSVILGEEARLTQQHGEDFAEFCRQVPRFWPSFSKYREPKEYSVAAASFRKELGDVSLFIAAGGLIEFVDAIRDACGLLPLAVLY